MVEQTEMITGKARCTMSISADLIEKVDKLVEKSVFASRSHAAERALKQLINELTGGEK